MVYSWRVNFKLCLAVTHLANNDLGYRLVSRKKPLETLLPNQKEGCQTTMCLNFHANILKMSPGLSQRKFHRSSHDCSAIMEK